MLTCAQAVDPCAAGSAFQQAEKLWAERAGPAEHLRPVDMHLKGGLLHLRLLLLRLARCQPLSCLYLKASAHCIGSSDQIDLS